MEQETPTEKDNVIAFPKNHSSPTTLKQREKRQQTRL
mgnify:CR=1 FL=1